MDLEGAGSTRAMPSPTAQSAQGERERQQQQQDGKRARLPCCCRRLCVHPRQPMPQPHPAQERPSQPMFAAPLPLVLSLPLPVLQCKRGMRRSCRAAPPPRGRAPSASMAPAALRIPCPSREQRRLLGWPALPCSGGSWLEQACTGACCFACFSHTCPRHFQPRRPAQQSLTPHGTALHPPCPHPKPQNPT
jgi:hypothetical protein